MSFAPGWYDDGHGETRWWDGRGWTSHVRGRAPSPDGSAPFVVRTSRVKMVLGLIASAVFIAAAPLGFSLGLAGIALSLVAIVFFGYTGWIAIRTLRKSAVLSEERGGLRTREGGLVPWDDLEMAGTFRDGNTTALGLRLRSTDRYIASLSQSAIDEHMTVARLARPAAFAAAAARVGEPLGALDNAADAEDLARIAQLPTASFAAYLLWARETVGYEVHVPGAMMARRASHVAADLNSLIERRRSR